MRMDLGVSVSVCPQYPRSRRRRDPCRGRRALVGVFRGALESHPDAALRGCTLKRAYPMEEADLITDRLSQTEVGQRAFLINDLRSISSHPPWSLAEGR